MINALSIIKNKITVLKLNYIYSYIFLLTYLHNIKNIREFRLIDYTVFIFDNLHDTQIYEYEYAIVYFITSYRYASLR